MQIEEFVGHWLTLETGERTRLGSEGATLGSAAVAGGQGGTARASSGCTSDHCRFEQHGFLPGGTLMQKMVDWVRWYLCYEFDWDVRLILRKDDVPPLSLGQSGRLGWTSWLGRRQAATDAGDLCVNAEAFAAGAEPEPDERNQQSGVVRQTQ